MADRIYVIFQDGRPEVVTKNKMADRKPQFFQDGGPEIVTKKQILGII